MASERGELGKFFDWLDNENGVDELMQENNIGEIKRKMKWLKKAYEEECKEKYELYDLLREEGYFYCGCCNKWKKPVGEACTLWDMPE